MMNKRMPLVIFVIGFIALLHIFTSTVLALDFVNLKVPFLCQAPLGDWSEPWQDACEEAAIIMAMHYVKGEQIDKVSGKAEILALVGYQQKKYGGHYDLTVKTAAKLLQDYYSFGNYVILNTVTIKDIKQEVEKGNLVIVPADGRLLGNRFYHQPGPPYHYLVIKGFDDRSGEFITNDAGTKRGANFRYKYGVVMNAIHDWAGSRKNILDGPKNALVIYKVANHLED
jgi:hypothetical protein